jgi:hypothetical protein
MVRIGLFFFLRLLKLLNYQFLLKNWKQSSDSDPNFLICFHLIFVLSLSYQRTQSNESFSKVELYKNVG